MKGRERETEMERERERERERQREREREKNRTRKYLPWILSHFDYSLQETSHEIHIEIKREKTSGALFQGLEVLPTC